MLHKVVIALENVDEILVTRDHSNDHHLAILSCGAVYYAAQGSNF